MNVCVARSVCTKCGVYKDASEFHADPRRLSGLRSHCKACINGAVRRWRRVHPEAVADYARWTAGTPQVLARLAVRAARRTGRLVRPSRCTQCGARRPEAHHPDYGRPLDVVWLCRTCHGAAARKKQWKMPRRKS